MMPTTHNHPLPRRSELPRLSQNRVAQAILRVEAIVHDCVFTHSVFLALPVIGLLRGELLLSVV